MRILVISAVTLALTACGDAPANDSATIDEVTLMEDAVALEEQAPSLSGPQRNARRSAQAYLQMQGFSKAGLIEQLSSDAGDGYAVADATAAVESLDVDWNQQAARSAQSYLSMMGFSCDGLVDQLSSQAGDKYTTEQARFGAMNAGAC